VISGFRRDVDETSVPQGCYAACSGKSLPTFRANYWSYLQENTDLSGQLSVLFSRKSLPTFWNNYRYYLQESLKVGPPIICLETSVSNFNYTLPNNSEERRSRKQPRLDDRLYTNHLLCRRTQYVNHLA